LTSMCVSLVTGSRWIKRVNDMVTSSEIFFTIEIRRLGNQSLGRCWLRPTVSRLDLLCASGLGPADILIVMMNAGSDTTAIAMTNFLYIMMKHPHILAKLRAEIDGALKEEEPNMKVAPYAKVRNLPYLKACIDESLRLWPPTGAGLPRETPEGGTAILGQYIPGGVTVSVPTFTAHRDPNVGGRPDEFFPDRWLTEDAPVLISRYFMSFSFGGRACIGRNISYLEQMIFFATILRRYEFAFKQPDWELKRVEGLNTWPQQFPLKIWRREIPLIN
jgi:cytochrome P450